MEGIDYIACVITLENGAQVLANVYSDGVIQRWGAPAEDLATVVDVTEELRDALAEHNRGVE